MLGTPVPPLPTVRISSLHCPPTHKFQKRGSNKESLYSGVADSFIDSLNGAGWKVYEHHKKELTKDIFYRKDLGDTFLNMLNKITQDIYTKYYNK